ncbi:hypothetical protein [Metabacillus halosaccharovorans]|uniref:DUF4025 domain-containing protein n=1 Tax=Metabacillus halosaccharovorans TaxID=930124 RepID=A0ABT3DGS5_9BACI|nr:hypothetical protein [Metabacillus halosaccharovorans]MCV9885882.1 hypothetical protein [Metabacillus halosaccharovorans]
MRKDQYDDMLHLNGNKKEEHLEISSTGYGLESVTSTTSTQEDTRQTNQK